MCAERRNAQRGRPRRTVAQTLPIDLYDYGDDPAPRRSPRREPLEDEFDIARLPVLDDWPDDVPITEAEVQVFERWFGDVFDELFGPVDLPKSLRILSVADKDKP